MTQKKFDAILAKNDIARYLRDNKIASEYLIYCLKQIEAYTGEANQPSVDDILADDERGNL